MKSVPVRCFLFTGTVPVRCFLFTGTVPVRYFLFTGTVPVRYFLFTGTVPVNNLFLKPTSPYLKIMFTESHKIPKHLILNSLILIQTYYRSVTGSDDLLLIIRYCDTTQVQTPGNTLASRVSIKGETTFYSSFSYIDIYYRKHINKK